MKTSLRVLIVEDSEFDAQIIVSMLRKGGYELITERVETEAALRTALASKTWDIILADYNLPEFNASAALKSLDRNGDGEISIDEIRPHPGDGRGGQGRGPGLAGSGRGFGGPRGAAGRDRRRAATRQWSRNQSASKFPFPAKASRSSRHIGPLSGARQPTLPSKMN